MHKEDPLSASILMQTKLGEIDQLLAERNQLSDQEKKSPIYKIITIEGLLLKDYRDWCVYEFSHIYADIKAYKASENLYYFLNGTSNALYSVSGGLASIMQKTFIADCKRESMTLRLIALTI